MLYYKNILNGELAGLTPSPYPLNLENFFEITPEEYIELGGYIPEPTTEPEPEPTPVVRLLAALVD